MRRNSSNVRRCSGRLARVSSVGGRWISWMAVVRSMKPRSRSWSSSSGSAKPRALVRSSADRDEPAQLPRVHVGFARRRVHRHEHAGVGAGLARFGDHVDDRVRHLAPAAVVLDPPEERGFGANGRVASRATPG